MNKGSALAVLFLILVSFLIFGCVQQQPPGASTTTTSAVAPTTTSVIPPTTTTVTVNASRLKTDLIDLSGVESEKARFTKYYRLEALDIPLQTLQYTLPLSTDQISNLQAFSSKISLSQGALDLLVKNGFVVVANPLYQKTEDFVSTYATLKHQEVPVFITSDSLLHLYHIQFDETLRQIEEREFYEKIWQTSYELFNDSVKKYESYPAGDLKEAAKRNAAYFAVGLELLKPKQDQLCTDKPGSSCQDSGIASAFFKSEDLQKYSFTTPGFVKSDVDKELDLIEKHLDFSVSPIFKYREDYSQFIPRGHYTRSEKLKNYFKAFMWYGRLTFLIKKDLIASENKAYDAKIHTLGASLIASKFSETPTLKEKWDRIYTVTAFYVGFSDDLGPYEYIKALNTVFSGSIDVTGLSDANLDKLKIELAKFSGPRIYGGTGECILTPPFTVEKYLQCLESGKGMRLMGQRFIPDSYAFSNLVGPQYLYKGAKEPFTMSIDGMGRKIRGFPRGLDAMAILGSDRAMEILNELDDTNYEGYAGNFSKLKAEFEAFTPADWNKNLYWGWLYALKTLLKESNGTYPSFMQTKAWQDKELTTALASWSQLRHDTILYAKQSYTPAGIGLPPAVVGYVEPLPEFYNRLLSL
ncbi:DUF3160 domain-containing protein, partial [Candidatus Micrarchaeota archaeon]|nr:DUF3160 domain-containing protein [Candidatus Micrarchaeota archaeon]